MALAHAVRALLNLSIIIHGIGVPQFASMIAVVVGICLAAWMFYAAR